MKVDFMELVVVGASLIISDRLLIEWFTPDMAGGLMHYVKFGLQAWIVLFVDSWYKGRNSPSLGSS